MFGTLDRYLGRSILSTSLLVLVTLIALAGVFAFIAELEDVGKGHYTPGVAAQYVLLTLPGVGYLLFAPAVLLGSLLGLGALATNSELTVMRAAGVSVARSYDLKRWKSDCLPVDLPVYGSDRVKDT